MKPLNSISEVIRHLRQNYSNPTALNFQEKGKWVSHSTEDFLKEVKYLALGLKALGLKKGDRVGILTFPSPYWVIADFAILLAGGVSVPLFANISDENFLYEVTSTKTKMLFVSGQDQRNIFLRHKNLFDVIIAIDPEGLNHDPGIDFKEVMKLGQKLDYKQPNLYDELENDITPDTVATIIHTSGSTGIPKGVVHTHQSLFALTYFCPFNVNEKDRYLNILPLAHIFGRYANNTLICTNASIYYTNDIKNVGAVCREIHPTFLVVVPRLLEKIYAKMLANVQKAGFMKRTLGLWAFELANMEDDSLFKLMLHPFVDKIVYSAMREALGGSIKAVVSGGATLNPHLCHFFNNIGIQIYEGWGLTEATPVTGNYIGSRKIGTVGRPLPGMTVKVSSDKELLVKGPLVMSGYYHNPEATNASLDEEGWLHTGDKGSIDEEGFVSITGRLKEMYKTSTGEYIAPVPIEQELCKAALIDMALVVGHEKKFASCLLFPDLDVLHSLKTANDATEMSDEEFLNSEFVQQEMHALLDRINSHLNHWEQLHAYRFILQPLTVESGELTPSMKIRREVVINKFSHLIDSMYAEKEEVRSQESESRI